MPARERARQVRAALTRINLDDSLAAFGVQPNAAFSGLLRNLLWWPADGFAARMLEFDLQVARHGLRAAANWLLPHYSGGVRVTGLQHVASSGALLIVCNHPGMADTLALLASIARTDLRVLAGARPFLQCLRHSSEHLILLNVDGTDQLRAVRSALRHLQAGGALLTFPGGEIEPDPAALPGAAAALTRWSESVGLFARMAPHTQIVPAIVSGAISPASLRNPLTRLRRAPRDQQRFAVALQVLWPGYRRAPVQLAFGAPLTGAELARNGAGAAAITRTVASAAQVLVQHASGYVGEI